MGKKNGLMTEGVIWKQLLLFSVPLLLGNIFQQLYNTVDSVIVGNYVGDSALAAVGASGPIMNLLISFFMGVGIGGSVIISQYFGAQNLKKIEDSVHTTIALSIISGFLLMIVGIVGSPWLLQLIMTPADVLPEAIAYLQVYFAGIVFVVLYNMGGSVLRAVGDSKRPLYYLILASLLNVVLDVVFVVYFKMGIVGAAWATTISQMISAIFVVHRLCTTTDLYRVYWRKLRIDMPCFIEILRIGLPSALSNTIVSFSNVIVQSNINIFGKMAMAGCNAYSRIDGFAIMPMMSLSMALTTFAGQNIGAGKQERLKQGARIGIALTCGIVLTMSLLLFVFAEQVLVIFSQEPEVLHYGSYMMRSVVPGYIFLSITHILSGILRGVGKTIVPMLIMIAFWCGLRMVWISCLMPIYQDIYVVFSGYVVTWFMSAISLCAYYRFGKWMPKPVQ